MEIKELCKILSECDREAKVMFKDLNDDIYEFTHFEYYKLNGNGGCGECGHGSYDVIINIARVKNAKQKPRN